MRSQLLAGPPASDAVAAVTRVVGVQAQSPGPPRLAVRARTSSVVAGDVDRLCADRTLVCTWAMRGTLHLVPAADVRWLVGLLGPVFTRKDRRRRETLGLDERTCERGLEAIVTVLRPSGPLTRAELITSIANEGVHVDATTQAPAHLLMYAATTGLLCRGPDTGPGRSRGGGGARAHEPTYVLLDEWVPGGRRLERDEALAELARRYLAGHGPARVADLLAWSGLPAADGRRAFELIADETEHTGPGHAGSELVALPATGSERAGPGRVGPERAGSEPAPLPGMGYEEGRPRLLGHFDPLLLGYRGRDLVLDPAYGKRIQAGGGFVQPAIVVDGRVAGTWRLNRSTRTAEIALEPFTGLPPAVREALHAEAEDIGRFLGHPVTLA
ncbi:winged helix DNA-binding domain-containing protein [Actinomadura sp. DC4]|uniref:winged helix DNA-binding domain-containing protein n=1 Tax=Actinomadura sp. DC4 TaxID=3055069 RepID=UPI0025B05440|nr:winged helix DNA-binding domain-containing protein [Actinomadura sp. DC4]MDN3355717.1 winged helix DNA-binding domain-containing protein [Actinomadura sp. DC4]